jgi:hypothetical protein
VSRRQHVRERVAYLEILCDFTDESLERKLADQEFSRLLVPSDLTKSDSSGTEAMGFLDATGCLTVVGQVNVKLEGAIRRDSRWQSCERQTWMLVVCEGLCHQSTCGQFV